jgi:3-phenylpropionate/trans-cinnamate dioxygenase ferredoxin reductase subunit
VVVVGTGWIGSEAATSIRQLGRQVTLIGPDAAPLVRVLGPEVAAVYRDLHADHGVRLLLETRMAGFRGDGQVEAVVTDDGRTIEGDLVLVGAGAIPRTELAEAAGLPVADGVLVNEELEAVGAAGVYAAGDVAAAWHAAAWDRVVVRGDLAARTFIAFWLKDQRVVAGMNTGVWEVTEPIQTLIRGGWPVDPARLADLDIPLDQVTGESAAALATRSIR